MADSLARAGRQDGLAAAKEVGVGGYFFGGLLGGLPLGFAGSALLTVEDPHPEARSYAAGGLLVAGGMAVYASRSPSDPPALFAERVEAQPSAYGHSFRQAYGESLQRRRREAALLGGTVGAAVGAGMFFLLLSQLPDT